MRVAILQPPAPDHIRNDKETISKYFPSLGIYYIYEYLKENNIECEIFDFYKDDWSIVYKVLENTGYFDIVGITCLTYNRVNSLKLAKYIKENFDSDVVLGGVHATHMFEQIIKNNIFVDEIILGEGEINFLGYIMGGTYNFFKNHDTFDLDKLPFPFRSQNSEFFPTVEQVNPLLAKYLLPEERKYKYTMILTSRGCPYNCQFCSATKFWGRKWRFRSPENVVNEIEYYYKNFGVRYFEIIDDAFTINKSRAIHICALIIKRHLNIRFNCRTRANVIDEELVHWMKLAGCHAVGLGVESGSQKILKTINKNIDIETIIRAFLLFRERNIIAYPYIMVGNPGETEDTINTTILLLKYINPVFIAGSITTIYPRTGLYELAKEQGFIDDDYWLTDKLPPYYTYEHSQEQLEKWLFKIINCNKNRFVRIIHKLFIEYPILLKIYKVIKK